MRGANRPLLFSCIANPVRRAGQGSFPALETAARGTGPHPTGHFIPVGRILLSEKRPSGTAATCPRAA